MKRVKVLFSSLLAVIFMIPTVVKAEPIPGFKEPKILKIVGQVEYCDAPRDVLDPEYKDLKSDNYWRGYAIVENKNKFFYHWGSWLDVYVDGKLQEKEGSIVCSALNPDGKTLVPILIKSNKSDNVEVKAKKPTSPSNAFFIVKPGERKHVTQDDVKITTKKKNNGAWKITIKNKTKHKLKDLYIFAIYKLKNGEEIVSTSACLDFNAYTKNKSIEIKPGKSFSYIGRVPEELKGKIKNVEVYLQPQPFGLEKE